MGDRHKVHWSTKIRDAAHKGTGTSLRDTEVRALHARIMELEKALDVAVAYGHTMEQERDIWRARAQQ